MPLVNPHLLKLCEVLCAEGSDDASDHHEVSDSQQQPSKAFLMAQKIASLTGPQNYFRLSLDSREIDAEGVFFAVFGQQTDGHRFISTVLLQGCSLVFAETKDLAQNNLVIQVSESTKVDGAAQVWVFNLREKLGQLAKAFYQSATQSMIAPALASSQTITAITGTNGKTSVASLIAQWRSLLGDDSASIGTLGVKQFTHGNSTHIGDTLNTSPDIVSLYTYIAHCRRLGIQHIALEASSHGLAQKRLDGLDIECGVFTNLSQDHLDYHKSMEQYGAAKRRLLQASQLRYMVLNADDPEASTWLNEIQTQPELAKLQLVWFSLKQVPPRFDNDASQSSYCVASDLRYTQQGCEFTLNSSWGQAQLCIALIGHFNVANVLAAASALLVQGCDFNALVDTANKLSGVAGRMELFRVARVNSTVASNSEDIAKIKQKGQAGQRANILVDYAHTPDALKQALSAARLHTRGKLYCVFGCGGDRDRSKRALMGAVADKYADKLVLTQDNSRSEAAQDIVADILKGISPHKDVEIEFDRKEAIKQAWLDSDANDLILLAGKGHETYMEINNQRIDYDERAYVAGLLNMPLSSNTAVCGGLV